MTAIELHSVLEQDCHQSLTIESRYDSAGGFVVSTSVEKSIANVLQTDGDFITINSVNCDQQTNTNYSGICATANAVSSLHGLDPRKNIYKPDILRAHLLQCMIQAF